MTRENTCCCLGVGMGVRMGVADRSIVGVGEDVVGGVWMGVFGSVGIAVGVGVGVSVRSTVGVGGGVLGCVWMGVFGRVGVAVPLTHVADAGTIGWNLLNAAICTFCPG